MMYDQLVLNAAVFVAMAFHLFQCPYTKVEESFNMQAIHDILYHGTNLTLYDHHEFPGVVPRTFIGPLLISSFAYPIKMILSQFQLPKSVIQIIVRGILGALVCFSYLKFQSSITTSKSIVKLSTILTIIQFHFLFYASRTLPNSFALVLVLLAMSSWMSKDNVSFIAYSGMAIILFRAELCIILGLLLLIMLFERGISLVKVILLCASFGSVILGITVGVDSYFWNRWLWPEGEVFYYNTILNKSSNWGTMPFFWYFYSAIPRVMVCCVLFVPVGLISQGIKERSGKLTCATLLYAVLYSFLPHKELRFIIYVFPVLNVTAATGILDILYWCSSKNAFVKKLSILIMSVLLATNVTATAFLSYLSVNNYPGGEAFHRLHILNKNRNEDILLSVHICNAATQTGVTRFQESYPHWKYSKDETFLLTTANEKESPYSFVITGSPCPENLKYYTKQDTVKGLSRIKVKKKYPFVQVILEEKLCILRNIKEELFDD